MATFYPALNEIQRLMVPPTNGERMLLRFLDSLLGDPFEVFFQPHLNGSHPDFVILRKGYGVFIIEVKDWTLSLYAMNDSKSWSVKTGTHQRALIKSPVEQINKYRKDCHDLYLREFYNRACFDKRMFGLIGTGLFFSQATREDIIRFEMNNQPFPKYMQVFGQDSLTRDCFIRILQNVHLSPYPSVLFDDDTYHEFRRILMPTMHKADEVTRYQFPLKGKRAVLATSVAGRRAKVRGVAGSGKTRLLAELAVNAYLRTKSEVLILTFNITLRNYIHDLISLVRRNFPWEKFTILHYHAFVGNYWNDHLSKEIRPTEGDGKFVIPHAPHKYKTILVDEIQDFKKEWIDSIFRLLDENGEMVFFGDEKQNIYSRKMTVENGHNFPNTGIPGRWNELVGTFRMDNTISELANKFQQVFLTKKYDYDTIAPASQNLFYSSPVMQYHYLENFSRETIFDIYYKIAHQEGLNDNDICFLCSKISPLRELETEFLRRNYRTTTTFETEEVFRSILLSAHHEAGNPVELRSETSIAKNRLSKIRRSKKYNFHMDAGKIKMATIHSFKGWEIITAFLIIMDERHTDKYDNDGTNPVPVDELIYTALTRARNNLIVVNIGDTRYDSFFRDNIPARH